MATHRAHLNRAAAQVAEKLGLKVRAGEPYVHYQNQESPMPAGYFRMDWDLVDEKGVRQARVRLECEGGYGAGQGKGWFAGHVSVYRLQSNGEPGAYLGGHKLVHQWDYVCDGPRSAKETRARFVTWAAAYQPPEGAKSGQA